VSDIDLAEAVEAVVRAVHDGCGCIEVSEDAPLWAAEDALTAITAALPHVREQIARKIEAVSLDGLAMHANTARAVVRHMARVVRGGQR